MPHRPTPPRKKAFARKLRREPTEAEVRLWEELRDRRLDGIKFHRQASFDPFTADFFCAKARLVVEVDGSQHGDSVSDQRRTAFFNGLGLRVLRFWNDEVLHEMNAVCDTIIAYVRDQNLQPWR
jgi:very-short-patch-repair endonuclease